MRDRLAVVIPSSIWSEGTKLKRRMETSMVITIAIDVAYTYTGKQQSELYNVTAQTWFCTA